jgi:hypothetical protein
MFIFDNVGVILIEADQGDAGLGLACQYVHVEYVKFLIETRMNFKIIDNVGFTDIACYGNNINFIKLLIDKGSDCY